MTDRFERFDEYAGRHTTPRSAALEQLDARTREQLGHATMLTGGVVGTLLQTLVASTGARRVLEIGTFSGVTALAMAAALPADGELITCEFDAEHAAFAREAFADEPRIDLREAPALDTIATLEGPFELVFVDADKVAYPDYVEATLPLIPVGRGLIVLDNMLQGGRVLDAEPETDEARILHELNGTLAARDDLSAVLLPVRDGLTLVRRLR